MRVSRATERRFVLGMQGLWPGRRWRGKEGIRAALAQCRQVQVDPLDVVGRNHDLVLASRVADYDPTDLDSILYEERAAFEYGGTLSIFPRDRLGLLASALHHYGLPTWWRQWQRKNHAATARVLDEIRRLGPLDSRHWIDGRRTENYRSRRVEGVALHYLWRGMEILVHHRTANRKAYDLTERLFSPLPPTLSLEDTRVESALELTRWLGLSSRLWLSYLPGAPGNRRRSLGALQSFRRALIDSGRLTEVEIEGHREPGLVRTEDLPLLEPVEAGEVPRKWAPRSPEVEAVFLGPLDIVSKGGRSRSLFGFDYVWEVYKRAADRRWGYYVLPVLMDDRLVGRIEPTRDRRHGALRIDRAWWEPGVDPHSLVGPLARGLWRSAEAIGLPSVRLGKVGPSSFRDNLRTELTRVGR